MNDEPGQRNSHYHRYLVDFMSFYHEYRYDKNKLFDKEDLNRIVPDDIKIWMQHKSFGRTGPIPAGNLF